jgi:hypothetical protein
MTSDFFFSLSPFAGSCSFFFQKVAAHTSVEAVGREAAINSDGSREVARLLRF